MWQQIITSKKFLFSLALISLIALVLSLIKPKDSPPELLRSVPTNNQNDVSVLRPIELQFRGPVDPADLSVSSSPASTWDVVTRGDTFIVLTHSSPLKPKTKYVLSLSWKNQPLLTLNFETEASQTDYELIKDTKAIIAKDYPLASLIPYDTPLYHVVYSAPLTLEITLKNPSTSKDQAIEDLKTWVSSNKLDSASHQYVFAKL